MLGDIVVCERINEGGHGVVYRGEQRLLGRNVVIKVLHQRMKDNAVAKRRFMQEARLASTLDHPYAAHVYSFGVEREDGLVWIAMELVQGITFHKWLKTCGPMPLAQFVPFFEDIAQVVHAAHGLGIIHRDLKPSNLMLIERGGRIIPKLLDLGIAKQIHVPTSDDLVTPPQRTLTDPESGTPVIEDRITRASEYVGSPPYMAPEQWRPHLSVGPAADLYALGVLAYEALTGRLPFFAQAPHEYCRCHLFQSVPPLGDAFSPNLDRVIQRALAKYPEHRQSNTLELASELRAELQADPREQLRSSAQRWREQDQSPDLLLRGQVLAKLEQVTRSTSKADLSELECSLLATSLRRARRVAWVRRSLGALAVLGVFGALLYRSAMQTRSAQQLGAMQTRSAQQLAEVTVTQAELEQGRSALLHGEPEAQSHLAVAYQHDHLPSTAFMLARALQPRLAEQARFASSSGRMWSAVFSPDGTQIVTTDDRNAQVRDAQTGRLLFTLAHGSEVYHAVYSADGARLVTAANDAVRIWDVASGALVHDLKQKRGDGKPSDYAIAAMSPNGKLVAAIDPAGSVADVWDAGTDALLAQLRNDALGFPSVAFSADGRWLATSGGNDVRVFNTRTWAQVRTIPGPGIYGLSWDPSGPRLLTGSAEGGASIWAIPSGERIHHLREIGEPVDAVAFSPDGHLVVAASRDGAEQVWDAISGKLRSQGNYLHGKILSVEFDRTSMLVVAAGASGSVAVADAELGTPVTVLDGPRNVVMVAHFDPSGRRVVGASWDGTARVWDATAPYRRWSSPPISSDCGFITSLESDRRFIAVGCIDHPTRVWDTTHAQLLAELPSVTQVDGDFASAFPAVSTAGDRAAIARGNTVELYELPGGRLLRTIAHGAAVNSVAFAITGRDLISGAVDGSLIVARDNGALLTLPTVSRGIDAAGFLADGRMVAADAQRRLRVYDPGGAVLADLEVSARVRTLRQSLDSRRLITVTVPNYMGKAAPPELWDLEHYRPIAQLESQGQVYSARFVSGGQIVTACGDGAARLWDGATGQLRQTYRGGSRFLVDVTLSPDGSMIVAGGGDGLLRFWDAASGRPLWTMLAHKSYLVGIRVEGDDIVTRGFSGDISRWTLPKPNQVIEACSDHDRCGIMSR
jgi:WD40 repeat protein/serine/threonine protein kinase